MRPLFYFIIMFALFTGWLIEHTATVQATHQYKVQQICDQAHVTTNGDLEKACGNVQDKYHMEYICNNLQIDAVCSTEIKQ